jgi:hypothetical protein
VLGVARDETVVIVRCTDLTEREQTSPQGGRLVALGLLDGA